MARIGGITKTVEKTNGNGNGGRRSYGGRPSWQRTPLDNFFERKINEFKEERQWTQPELARHMTFVEKSLARWRAEQIGVEFVEIPNDTPLERRKIIRQQEESKGNVVWNDWDNAVTTQTAFDALHLETQPTVGRVYVFARAFNEPIASLFPSDEWMPTMEDRMATRWNSLTDEQRDLLVSLADSFIEKNVRENTIAPVEA